MIVSIDLIIAVLSGAAFTLCLGVVLHYGGRMVKDFQANYSDKSISRAVLDLLPSKLLSLLALMVWVVFAVLIAFLAGLVLLFVQTKIAEGVLGQEPSDTVSTGLFIGNASVVFLGQVIDSVHDRRILQEEEDQ